MLQIVLFTLSVLFASVSGWGGCTTTNFGGIPAVSGSFICVKSSCGGSDTYCDFKQSGAASCNTVQCPSSYVSGGRYYTNIVPNTISMNRSNGYGTYYCRTGQGDYSGCTVITSFYAASCAALAYCTSQAEADSLNCALNPSAPGCASPCSAYQKQCDAAKGEFTSRIVDGKCWAQCNTCGEESVKTVAEKYRQMCCDQKMAPPENPSRCYVPLVTGPGMQSSVYQNSTTEYKCQDPNLDSLTSERYYQMCFDYDPDAESSDDGGNSSSGDGSSSSGDGGSSGSQYPEGCDECPWLDSILDTLTLQKGKVDAIYDCLTLPGLCSGMENERDTTIINIDSALLKYITPYLDSTIRLDSSQLRALQKLDTNLLKAMKNDSVSLDNDTMIYRAISDAGYTNDTNLIELRGRVFRMDTAMRHRLDSLIKSLPNDVLDSIVKYQDSTIDRIDSALWGKGVGFSLIDSLVDSTVKYFKESNHYDSVYNRMFHDFDSTLMGKLDNMEVTGELGLDGFGYGDTASKSLRDDIEGLRDGVDSLLGLFGEGSADDDNTYDGYLTGYDTAAVQFANNLGSALGGALADSTYDGIFVLDSSTVGLDSGYRIVDLDSAQQALQASNDSVKSALADTMQSWFDELRHDFVLVNFDSAIIAPLGAKVPNTNTCPEDCFKIDLSNAGAAFKDVKGLNWGLCQARIGSMNVLQFVRLILRIITALTCVYIGLWFISGRKS